MTDATETETDDEATTCETCGRELSDSEVDDFGDECTACHQAKYFTCPACEGEIEREEDQETNQVTQPTED